MGYRVLADLTVLAHLGFIVFVVIGVVAVARWPRLLPVHVACAVWGAYTEFTSTVCPLTPLENHFRRLAGQAGYEGGFIEHYLMPVLYPAGLTPGQQRWIGGLVVAINVVAYALAIRPARARRAAEAGTGVASTVSDPEGKTS